MAACRIRYVGLPELPVLRAAAADAACSGEGAIGGELARCENCSSANLAAMQGHTIAPASPPGTRFDSPAARRGSSCVEFLPRPAPTPSRTWGPSTAANVPVKLPPCPYRHGRPPCFTCRLRADEPMPWSASTAVAASDQSCLCPGSTARGHTAVLGLIRSAVIALSAPGFDDAWLPTSSMAKHNHSNDTPSHVCSLPRCTSPPGISNPLRQALDEIA